MKKLLKKALPLLMAAAFALVGGGDSRSGVVYNYIKY